MTRPPRAEAISRPRAQPTCEGYSRHVEPVATSAAGKLRIARWVKMQMLMRTEP